MNTEDIRKDSLLVAVFFFSQKIFTKGLYFLSYFFQACFNGFWLGVLRREDIYYLDGICHSSQRKYHKEEYNQQGLWKWEKAALDKYFQGSKHLLVSSAGGGREVLALSRLGYEVEAFECLPSLVEFANDFLAKNGVTIKVHFVPPDQCLETNKAFDGLIIGWGAYTLIQGKERRIAFLKKMHLQAKENAPILLSFYTRFLPLYYYKMVVAVANIVRFLLRREAVEAGDNLSVNYTHHFSKKEIADELGKAGFELVFYDTADYGCAVGKAIHTEGGLCLKKA